MNRFSVRPNQLTPTAVGKQWKGGFVRCVSRFLLGLTLCLVGGSSAIPISAQESWSFSPYDTHVWIGLGPSPRLTVAHRKDIQRQLAERSLAWAGYSWMIESEPVPAELNTDVTRNLAYLSAESVVAQIRGPEKEKTTAKSKEKNQKPAKKKKKTSGSESTDSASPYLHLLKKDKLFLLSVTDQGSSWRVQARELDLHTRTLGPLYERLVQHPLKLGDAAFEVVAEAFHPIAKVVTSHGKSAELTVRAGGLTRGKQSPFYVGPRSVLRPVVRRNNRLGEPLKEGVVEIDWTYIYVDRENYGQLDCQVWSAMRNPVAGRTSSRTQRFGLLVRPTGRSTELKLVAQEDESHTLKGYDIFVKTPQPIGKEEPVAKEEEAKKLGQTDWRGVITVEPIKSGVRVIYVKNGRQLLARLPLVPGYYPHQTALLPNDDSRLKVESFVTGIQNSLLDLVVQQKVLEIRIQGKIKAKKYQDAQLLLAELHELTSMDDLRFLMRAKEQEIFSERNMSSRLEGKIRQLFSQTRDLMGKYYDPNLEDRLAQQLRKSGGGKPKP